MNPFTIETERFLILDGATGTALANEGLPAGCSVEGWVLGHPEAIQRVQAGYVAAGSDVVYSCTFGGNGARLKKFGMDCDVKKLNFELATLSKQVGASCVAGSVGPTGLMHVPYGATGQEEMLSLFRPQIEGLAEAGVDYIIIETMMDIREARAAVLAAKEVCRLPVAVTLTVEANGRTLSGTSLSTALVTLSALGVSAVGLNCSAGPAEMSAVLESAAQYAAVPMIAKPNAGLPETAEDGSVSFSMTPEVFASSLNLPGAVCMAGGCCGTGAGHIAALKKAMEGRKVSFTPCGTDGILTSHNQMVETGGTITAQPLAAGADMLDESFEPPYEEQEVLFITAKEPGDVQEIEQFTGMVGKPLCFACDDAEVLEGILRRYPGRAGVEAACYDANVSVCVRYGAQRIQIK